MSEVFKSGPDQGVDRGSDSTTGSNGAELSAVERLGDVGSYLGDIASQASCLAQLLSAEIADGATGDMAARLVAATALAERIGYMADLMADRLSAGVAVGDANEWFLSPQALTTIDRVSRGAR